MFEYVYPQFQSKRLLRAQMLEEIRDYPLRYLKLSHEGFAQGVAAGCRVTWSGGELTVGRGIIYKEKQFYFLEEPYTLDCGALDRVRFLKVRLLPENRSPGQVKGVGEIVLEERPADDAFELELCRFRLQEGARLRDRHENFADFSTEYDTVDYTYAPWSGREESTLNPLLLRQYAAELLRRPEQVSLDLAFAMAVLAQGGQVCARAVKEYIRGRTGRSPARGIRPMYEGLLGILSEGKVREDAGERERSVFLI